MLEREVEGADLPSACTPASVRPAARTNTVSPVMLADGVLQRRLDGPLSGLALPAREVGAVVLDDDAPTASDRGSKLEHEPERPGGVAEVHAVRLSQPGDVGVRVLEHQRRCG